MRKTPVKCKTTPQPPYGGDIENVTFFHDEQVQFDDIIGNNKALAERLSHDGILLNLPSADYNFRATAALNFRNSKNSIGNQAADAFAGFVSRYVYQKIWETPSVNADHDETYNHIQALRAPNYATGLNFVAPAALVEHLNRLRGGI